MELNLLEHQSMANGKNHVQHVCPLKNSQRTKTNEWEAASSPEDLFLQRDWKLFVGPIMIKKYIVTSTCGTFNKGRQKNIVQYKKRVRKWVQSHHGPTTLCVYETAKTPWHLCCIPLYCVLPLLWHWSACFTLLPCGHCNLLYSTSLLQASLCQMSHRGTKLLLGWNRSYGPPFISLKCSTITVKQWSVAEIRPGLLRHWLCSSVVVIHGVVWDPYWSSWQIKSILWSLNTVIKGSSKF